MIRIGNLKFSRIENFMEFYLDWKRRINLDWFPIELHRVRLKTFLSDCIESSSKLLPEEFQKIIWMLCFFITLDFSLYIKLANFIHYLCHLNILVLRLNFKLRCRGWKLVSYSDPKVNIHYTSKLRVTNPSLRATKL